MKCFVNLSSLALYHGISRNILIFWQQLVQIQNEEQFSLWTFLWRCLVASFYVSWSERTNMFPSMPKPLFSDSWCWNCCTIFHFLERCFFASFSFECADEGLKLEEAQLSNRSEGLWICLQSVELSKRWHKLSALSAGCTRGSEWGRGNSGHHQVAWSTGLGHVLTKVGGCVHSMLWLQLSKQNHMVIFCIDWLFMIT